MTDADGARPLDTLAGTYGPIGWERARRAVESLGETLTACSFALATLVFFVGYLVPAVWDSRGWRIFLHVVTVAGLLVSIGSAYAGATSNYVIGSTGVRVERGWPLPTWHAAADRVSGVRLVKGLFRSMLLVSLKSGRQKRLILSDTMRRTLEARQLVQSASRPTRG